MVTASLPRLAHAAHQLSDIYFLFFRNFILCIVSLRLRHEKKSRPFFLSILPFRSSCTIYRWFSFYPGGCINASPAGKRRIAAGAEQQIGDDISLVLNGIGGKSSVTGSGGDAGETNGLFVRFTSTTTAITSIAIAVCALIVTLFVIIFAVLQVNING